LYFKLSRTAFVFYLLFTTSIACSTPASAPPENIEPIHWAYSALFGTGWYNAKNNRTVFVLRLPFSQTPRESSISESGKRKIGIQVRYPLAVGLHDIDDFSGIIDPDNFTTVSFTPGIEMEIPIYRQWHLRPFINAGWGKELDSGNSAWIYYGGLKSRYLIPQDYGNWSLLAGLSLAGYDPDIGASDSVTSLLLGVEFDQPLETFNLAGEAIDLHWHLSYASLDEKLEFELPDDTYEPLKEQIKVGLAFSFRHRPLNTWISMLDRLGMEYSFDTHGNFEAITFNVNSWFKR